MEGELRKSNMILVDEKDLVISRLVDANRDYYH